MVSMSCKGYPRSELELSAWCIETLIFGNHGEYDTYVSLRNFEMFPTKNFQFSLRILWSHVLMHKNE